MMETLLVSRRTSFNSILFPLWFRNALHDAFQDLIRINTLGFSFKIQNHAMPQGRQYHVSNIRRSDMRAAAQQRAHFSADNDGLCAAGARPVSQVLLCE